MEIKVKDEKVMEVSIQKMELKRDESQQFKEMRLPSKEKIWMKYFPKEARDAEVSELTLYEQLKKSNEGRLDSVALSYFGVVITFDELIKNIDKTAKALKSQGIKKGDMVGICMPNQPETVYAFYALSKIGAIPNLIEPRTPAERIKKYMNDAGARYMITIDDCVENISKMVDGSILEKIIVTSPANSFKKGPKKSIYQKLNRPTKTNGRYFNWNDIHEKADELPDFEPNHYEKGVTASIVYTGGTTAIPKGAQLSNDSYNGQNMQLEFTELYPQKGDKFLGVVPIFSAYGSSSGMHNALCSNVEVILIPKFKTSQIISLIYKHKPTHVMGVPRWFEKLELFLERIDRLPNIFSGIKKKYRLDFVKHFISGGDKFLPEAEERANKFIEKFGGPKIKKGIGMSEFGGGVITTVSNEANKIGSAGIAHVGNNIKVVDGTTKEELTYNETGELYVTGPTMMTGYLNRPDENEKFFDIDLDGEVWARTGDVGYIDDDGLFYFIDRVKYVIMRPDGHTVPLTPIENTISKCDSVEACAAVGVPEVIGKSGERPMAFVVLKDDVKKSIQEIQKELQELCAVYLPEREGPKWFRFVDELPYTLLEKVDREKLKKDGIKAVEIGYVSINYDDKDGKKLEKAKQKVLSLIRSK